MSYLAHEDELSRQQSLADLLKPDPEPEQAKATLARFMNDLSDGCSPESASCFTEQDQSKKKNEDTK